MPGLEREPSPPLVMTQPRSPVCGSSLDLARTLKDERCFELKLFEFTNCEHSERWGS